MIKPKKATIKPKTEISIHRFTTSPGNNQLKALWNRPNKSKLRALWELFLRHRKDLRPLGILSFNGLLEEAL